MEIAVCSRGMAVGLTQDRPWAVISIRNPDMDPLPFRCRNLNGVLHLAFDDVDKVSNGYTAFSTDMAKQIWDFVKGLEVELLLVHCNLGASRSPAVAAALDKVLHGDDEKWFRTKTPNRRVYRCLLSFAQMNQ